ncbi:amidase [Novosphingobium sp. 9U]|uniref:amidase n=1 Tax=Novosphingobium sp. 9U TaxID=2653158 RepID=UPI0012F08928|nr:amidase [Novosphingobium sp. 9U]VWX50747.1 Amidase [Novosphingobium sp. 9U]
MPLTFAALILAASTPTAVRQAQANTEAAIARIQTRDVDLNAVIALDPTAESQARVLDGQGARDRPLFGLPILLKDNIESAGPLPTTAGSLALAGNVTGRDAPLVQRLRHAGAVILGKTNLSEWANMRSSHSMSGWSAVGGQTRNPHALNRTPCGSSSGSAVAVAAGMVDAAIGTETDGSITCPAAINGVVGFKPTLGLVSRSRIVPISHSQDTAGPIAKDVSTAARVLTAIAGSDQADTATREADRRRTDYAAALRTDALMGTRIGVLRLKAGWSPAVDALFERALAVLRAKGAILVDITEPEGRDKLGEAEFTVLLSEFKADLNAYLATTPPTVTTRTLADLIAFNAADPRELALFGQEVFKQAEASKGLEDPDYLAARALSLRLAGAEGIDAMLAKNNVVTLVAPTGPPAWMIDAVNGDQSNGSGAGSLAAVAGYPHLTVPMGALKGLPAGLSFIGPKWSDAQILSFGYAYEQASLAEVRPAFLRSVEDARTVAPLLLPFDRKAHVGVYSD